VRAVVEAPRAGGPPGGEHRRLAPLDPEATPRSVGPFCVATHHILAPLPAGALPVDADVRAHPHVGLVAVTWVVEGAVTHRDALGHCCELRAGDVGVLVSGAGVSHSERFERLRLHGGGLELFQLLLALEDGAEDAPPAFFRAAEADRPADHTPGARVRYLLPPPPGRPAGVPGTQPILLADVALAPGGDWVVPAAPERALYVRSGEIEVDGQRIGAGSLAVLGPGDARARGRTAARALAFGGTHPGPRFLWWNYLHSSVDAIAAARAAWRAGAVPLPVGDTESFTPAPPDDGRPLRRFDPPHGEGRAG
jgi:redox-sensitive bicupin YhaK (pirin superfamily)